MSASGQLSVVAVEGRVGAGFAADAVVVVAVAVAPAVAAVAVGVAVVAALVVVWLEQMMPTWAGLLASRPLFSDMYRPKAFAWTDLVPSRS